jgi:hypothetical protein
MSTYKIFHEKLNFKNNWIDHAELPNTFANFFRTKVDDIVKESVFNEEV